MDYDEPATSSTEPTTKLCLSTNKSIKKHRHEETKTRSPTPPTTTSSDEEITSYQKQPCEDLSPEEKPLSDDIPNHLFEDLCGYWRSHSYYQSRIRIFEGFATDGPFPSVTSFRFQDNPQTGLTRKFVAELDGAVQAFKEEICRIHSRNFTHLAVNEIKKINALTAEAKQLYNTKLGQETVQRARTHAFYKARENRRQKNKKNQKQRRSPSRGGSRERRPRPRDNH